MKTYFLKYKEFLNESLNSARTKYADKISQKNFKELTEADPSPTKKYLEKMCEWFINEDLSIQEISEGIKKFIRLLPKLEQKDINKYTTFEKFIETIDLADEETPTAQKRKSKDTIKSGTNIVFENEHCTIVQPKTKEESKVWGAGADWCTARQDDVDNLWNRYYYGKELTLYYIITKDDTIDKEYHKIAVCVNRWGFDEIRDFVNYEIDEDEFFNIIDENFGIDPNTANDIFVNLDKEIEPIQLKDYITFVEVSIGFEEDELGTMSYELEGTKHYNRLYTQRDLNEYYKRMIDYIGYNYMMYGQYDFDGESLLDCMDEFKGTPEIPMKPTELIYSIMGPKMEGREILGQINMIDSDGNNTIDPIEFVMYEEDGKLKYRISEE